MSQFTHLNANTSDLYQIKCVDGMLFKIKGEILIILMDKVILCSMNFIKNMSFGAFCDAGG